MTQKLAMLIRKITVAPVPAFALATILWLATPELMGDVWHYVAMVFCLSVLPPLAYPICAVVPRLKRGGRRVQRATAVAFSVAGYLLLLLIYLILGCTQTELLVCLTYLCSGALIGLMSYVIKFKPSGHACGVAGPIAMLVLKVSPLYAFGVILLAVVWWSSIVTKRHTPEQLGVGSIIPVLCMTLITVLTV